MTIIGQRMLQAGQEAPDFTLLDQNGQRVNLGSFRGHRAVALVFYTKAFTSF